MGLLQDIQRYQPTNEQEAADKRQMLNFMDQYSDYLERTNSIAHFSCSAWTINREHTKTLMVYHNIYQTWSWIGGHADGIEDLCAVALRELQEETGVKGVVLNGGAICSLDTLTVKGHMKYGTYVPSHLHFNVTYLMEANDKEEVCMNVAENSGVKWWSFAECLQVSNEPWMVEQIYSKLIQKCRKQV